MSSGTFNIGRKDRLWKNYHRLMLKHGKTEVCSQTNKLANDEKYWNPIFQFGFLPRTFCLPADTKLLRKVTRAFFFPHPTLSWAGMGEERRQRTVDCEASCYGSWLWHQGESVWSKPVQKSSPTSQVVNKWSQIPKTRPLVVQRYVARPYLINGDNTSD